MAIINLGSRPLIVGASPVLFDPFFYDQTQAYMIAANISVSNVANVYSFLRARAIVNVSSQPPFYLAPYTDLEIFGGLQSFFFAASSLFRGDGTCTLEFERLPVTFGSGDTPDVNVTLFYDNAVTVNSWRN